MVCSCHRQKVRSVEVVLLSNVLSGGISELFRHVIDMPSCSDCHSLFQNDQVVKVCDCLGWASFLHKLFEVVEILKVTLRFFPLCDSLQLFLNEREALLGHHCVIALVDGHWAVVHLLLGQERPN